ncbi:PASTA domain-containing protein [Myxococcota bacterium]|nr:PASTA domain-containing protein [Myxococcota bacterium]MBU1412899.1 PASTA domain-containing protein [Myxococcota bacterium]MBU1511210.1 PASTA domain-containing protein [Myxococcota bacterium]
MSRTSSVIALSVTTSLITSALTFVALQILLVPHLKTQKPEARPETPAAVEVPRLLGLRPDDAKIILKEKNLLLSLSKTTPHPTVAAGLIHMQMPLAGSMIVSGQSVVVEVSAGPPPAAVPLVVGKNVAVGRAELEKLGLIVQIKPREDKNAAPDQILSQNIEPGQNVTAGAAIELVVAQAAATPSLPDYKGKYFNKKDLTDELEKLGLKLGKVRYMDISDQRNGYIYGTNPEGGTQVAPGTAIDFRVQYLEE